MKYIIIASFLIPAYICSAQKRPNYEQSLPPVAEYYLWKNNSPRYATFTFNAKKHSDIFDKKCKPSTISKDEIKTIEKLISIRVNQYNATTNGRHIEQPDKYYKQFIAVINSKGEKEVWVNCSCEIVREYFQKSIEKVNDGGSCYFQLTINLTKNTLYNFHTNGLA